MREQRAHQNLKGPRGVRCYDTAGSQEPHAEYWVGRGDERGYRTVRADCIGVKKQQERGVGDRSTPMYAPTVLLSIATRIAGQISCPLNASCLCTALLL